VKERDREVGISVHRVSTVGTVSIDRREREVAI
jgi:hypothetical protein